MANIELMELLKAGVHFGHKAHRWNPKMFPYIYAEKEGAHIIDLVKTSSLLKKTCDFVQTASQEKKTFLFVGTKKQASGIVAAEAERAGIFYVNHRWLGGMLTNWITIKTRLETLNKLEKYEQDGLINKLPKKEAAKMMRELNRLRQYFVGVKNMKKIPDIIFIIDQKYESTALKEAISLNLPIISILDTNCDPDLITFGIPGNDDAIGSIQYITRKLADSILLGKEKSNKKIL
jgi:small subunit ribosomal protein S2